MKKEFLDELYSLRSKVINDIETLEKKSKEPRYKCCDNMDNDSIILAEMRTRRSQLESIDNIIIQYLLIHK